MGNHKLSVNVALFTAEKVGQSQPVGSGPPVRGELRQKAHQWATINDFKMGEVSFMNALVRELQEDNKSKKW
ncbi:hypothetical protein HanPSC8_Chr09g0402361 [Helianthus annuus]|nr:hypothetical protein HanPSC8_Chr09g0402361 [Helianthus annuus]